ncbi:MAG: hypothetical protein H7235_09495 [Bdellovibrionaceae bacterium]|nr:hypothetical protein [Pseudobdellovibrionaceae bacterium]
MAEDGHLYTLSPIVDAAGVKLNYTGRNVASTFPGYCSFHDTHVFKEIDFDEKNVPDTLSSKQMIIFFLRAISIEGWKKQSIVNSMKDLSLALEKNDFKKISEILEISFEMAKEVIVNPDAIIWSLKGHVQGLKDMQELMGTLLWQIANNKFHGTINYHWKFSSGSNIAVASGVSPLWDTKGKKLYASIRGPGLEEKMCHVGITIFEFGGQTNVLMSCLKKDHEVLKELFSQINDLSKNESEFKTWLTEFILENCENVVFRPSFINKLSPDQKNELEAAACWNLMHSQPPKKNLSFCFFRNN